MNKKYVVCVCACAILMGLSGMAISFYFFPKYICETVYMVNTSELEKQNWVEISEETSLSEEFIPKQKYLECINIHVGENEEGNLLLGKLTDENGKVLEEHTIEAESGFVEFKVQQWVSTEKKYTLFIAGHKGNKGGVPVTFGETVKGPIENISSWEGDVESKGTLWTQFVYHTYSRKLLVAWFLILFAISFLVIETIYIEKRRIKQI